MSVCVHGGMVGRGERERGEKERGEKEGREGGERGRGEREGGERNHIQVGSQATLQDLSAIPNLSQDTLCDLCTCDLVKPVTRPAERRSDGQYTFISSLYHQ